MFIERRKTWKFEAYQHQESEKRKEAREYNTDARLFTTKNLKNYERNIFLAVCNALGVDYKEAATTKADCVNTLSHDKCTFLWFEKFTVIDIH